MKTLAILVAASLFALAAAAADDPPPAPRVVEIAAKRFAFTPAEVHLKRGETVTLRFRSEDVTHGFLLRPLKLSLDLEPGKTVDALVTPAAAGTFTAICNHFCGSGHGGMKMKVIVEE